MELSIFSFFTLWINILAYTVIFLNFLDAVFIDLINDKVA